VATLGTATAEAKMSSSLDITSGAGGVRTIRIAGQGQAHAHDPDKTDARLRAAVNAAQSTVCFKATRTYSYVLTGSLSAAPGTGYTSLTQTSAKLDFGKRSQAPLYSIAVGVTDRVLPLSATVNQSGTILAGDYCIDANLFALGLNAGPVTDHKGNAEYSNIQLRLTPQ
jgi:hypothetical protein